MASQLIEANSRVVALEQELKATTEQSKIATKAKPYVAAGCVDNPGRGICAYYVVAAILQILDGIHLNNVSYAPTAIQKAKESVLSNALQFQENEGDTAFQQSYAMDVNQLINELNMADPPPADWGGFHTFSLALRHTSVTLMLINLPGLQGKSMEKAISEHIRVVQSVNEAEKSLTAYAIYTGSHYMLGTAKIDGEVRAVFQAEEAMEHRVSESLLKYLKEVPRAELVTKMLSGTKAKRKRKKKERKEVSFNSELEEDGPNDNTDDEEGWVKIGKGKGKRKREKTSETDKLAKLSKQMLQMQKQQTQLKAQIQAQPQAQRRPSTQNNPWNNAPANRKQRQPQNQPAQGRNKPVLVVKSRASPSDFRSELSRRKLGMNAHIGAVWRGKASDELVLAAQPAGVAELKNCIGKLRKIGLAARYFQDPSNANSYGTKKLLCRNVFLGKPCPHGAGCRFAH
jgi:hypothetical protein